MKATKSKKPLQPRHFLDLAVIDAETLRGIIDQSHARKKARGGLGRAEPDADTPLKGKLLAMIFERPSTRTRVSFDVAMRQLGGETLLLNGQDMQLGRGETIADTARVLSRYVDAIMLRSSNHANLLELAAHASVPVINALTNESHPCQLMGDVMTLEEHRGPIAKQVVAWSGDGNNVAASWVEAAMRFGFELRLACPAKLRPQAERLKRAKAEGARIMLTDDPFEAVKGADCVVTDTWVSMGDKESEYRHNLLAPYRVDERLMAAAKPGAVFMHCLPAHRGDEVTAAVIDGPRSIVWDAAENRLHAQKGVLAWCLAQ
jgi:ornithine carbamoyltransferase